MRSERPLLFFGEFSNDVEVFSEFSCYFNFYKSLSCVLQAVLGEALEHVFFFFGLFSFACFFEVGLV
jgi:hypothetical protein